MGGPSGGTGFESGAKNQGGDFGGQRRKNRVFAPVTMKMIQEASPRPDDVCEIEGEAINDVSIKIRVPFLMREGAFSF